MVNCITGGHILIVRRQSYIPSYFSVYESQLPTDNEYSEYKLGTAESEVESSSFYLLYSRNSAAESDYFTFPTRRSPENLMDSGMHTTRLLSSGLAKRFSCNVSKMAYRMRNRMVCDGYFGCPDEHISTEKGNVASLKRGKPVCILPWKKRQRCAKAKKKHAGKSVKTEVQTSKVDCVISSLERTKVSGIKTKGHVTRNQHSSGTKSHPAMFYSYYIAKGNALQYRKICAPKRRPCDGFFGCYDEGSIRGKKAGTVSGKRKPIPKY